MIDYLSSVYSIREASQNYMVRKEYMVNVANTTREE